MLDGKTMAELNGKTMAELAAMHQFAVPKVVPAKCPQCGRTHPCGAHCA
jgi:hypothetical protein